jgi:hypothetical protein
MKCPTCGSENLPNKKFCGLCGQSLTVQPAAVGFSGAATAPQPPPYVDPSQGNPPLQYAAPPPGVSFGDRPMMAVEKKYKALRGIATCFKILAFVLAILSVIGAVGMLIVAANTRREEEVIIAILSSIGSLILSGLIFLFYYGIAQLIHLLIDLEENTRITNMLLTNRR